MTGGHAPRNDLPSANAELVRRAYAKYAAQQLPVLYQPNPVAPDEIIKTLKSSIGFTPNPLGNFLPEYYSF